jgi:hypothetical protein
MSCFTVNRNGANRQVGPQLPRLRGVSQHLGNIRDREMLALPVSLKL